MKIQVELKKWGNSLGLRIPDDFKYPEDIHEFSDNEPVGREII